MSDNNGPVAHVSFTLLSDLLLHIGFLSRSHTRTGCRPDMAHSEVWFGFAQCFKTQELHTEIYTYSFSLKTERSGNISIC